MKPITNVKNLPTFLVVNSIAEKNSWNKYLPYPYKAGEIVMVAPAEQQVQHSHASRVHADASRYAGSIRHGQERF